MVKGRFAAVFYGSKAEHISQAVMSALVAAAGIAVIAEGRRGVDKIGAVDAFVGTACPAVAVPIKHPQVIFGAVQLEAAVAILS